MWSILIKENATGRDDDSLEYGALKDNARMQPILKDNSILQPRLKENSIEQMHAARRENSSLLENIAVTLQLLNLEIRPDLLECNV